MAYTVRTEHFEGPFDVLLSLIEKRKLHVSVISYIESSEKFPIGESANFVLIASTLLLIKSKSLLPTLELSEEERGSIEDLEQRLKEYQRIKSLSLGIKRIFGQSIMFSREETKDFVPVFSPDSRTTLENIRASIRKVLEQIPKIEVLPKVVVEKVMSLEEMITKLTDRITSNLKTSFKDFLGGEKKEKVNVIVGFLALLELVKRGAIMAVQENSSDEIQLETTSVGLPKYD